MSATSAPALLNLSAPARGAVSAKHSAAGVPGVLAGTSACAVVAGSAALAATSGPAVLAEEFALGTCAVGLVVAFARASAVPAAEAWTVRSAAA